MGLIEIEFTEKDVFSKFVRLVVSASPVPLPRLGPLGSDRLIAGLEWGLVTIRADAAGAGVPAGQVVCSAPVRIRHVSIAELGVDGNAQGAFDDATAWLSVRATTQRLIVDLTRIDVAGKASQVFATPLNLARERIPPVPAGVELSGASVLRGNSVITVRLGTNIGDDLFRPPTDRLKLPDGWANDWLIHVDGSVFAEILVSRLTDALDPPPSGASIEDAPSAAWFEVDGEWAARGSAGVLKEDACPSLLGRVGLSVEIEVQLKVGVNPELTKVLLDLHIASNVSDWDSFRCWAGGGFLVGTLLGGINPLLGIGTDIGSLVTTGSSSVFRQANRSQQPESEASLRKPEAETNGRTITARSTHRPVEPGAHHRRIRRRRWAYRVRQSPCNRAGNPCRDVLVGRLARGPVGR